MSFSRDRRASRAEDWSVAAAGNGAGTGEAGAPKPEPLRVLMVEDSEADAILLARELRRAGYDPAIERVDTAPALRAALDREPWDVALIDYVMPRFSALSALEMIRGKGLDLPCILVSGQISDEIAIEAMKVGAQDFIPKDALARLPQAIQRERRAAAARRAARENEARLQAIVETAVDGIVTIGEGGVVESFNPAAAKMFGYAPEEVIGQNVKMLMPEPYRSEHPGYIDRYLRTGEARIIGVVRDVEAKRKDGTTFAVHLSVSEARLDDRRLFTGILHDITERRRAEDALRQERDRAQSYLDMAGVIFVALDAEGCVTLLNRRGSEVLGYPVPEVVGRDWFELAIPERDRERAFSVFLQLMRGETKPVEYYENPVLTRSGEERLIAWHNTVLRDESGGISGTLSSGEDITERKRSEEALRESTERLERAQEIANLGSWELDLVHNRLTWSDEIYRIIGLQPQEFGATYEAFLGHVHPDDRAAVDDAYTGSLREGRDSYEIEHRMVRRATGEMRFVHEKCEHIRDESGRIIRSVGMVQDITERKRTEERLHLLAELSAALAGVLTEEETLRHTAAAAISGYADYCIMDLTENGGFRRAVAAGADAGKQERADALGAYTPRRATLDEIPQIARVLRDRQPLLLGDIGDEVLRAFAQDERHLEALRALDAGSAIIAPMVARDRLLGGITLIRTREQPRLNAQDLEAVEQFARRAALALDNARLYAAEQQARAEAQEANQAKDQFVALVSHELRNPLNAIAAGVHLLRATCPAEGRAGRALEIVERNVALQTRLVNDLLDLSRLQRGKLQLQRAPVDLEKVVASACHAYDAEASDAGLTFTCECEPGLWVHGDYDRLQQVVMNFLSNAVKFTPAGGSVSVRVQGSGFRVRKPDAAAPAGAHPEGSGRAAGEPAAGAASATEPRTLNPEPTLARITVADTGIGLDRAMLGHLFEQFHQGEVAGQGKAGLGLGLALVKGIAERHGGRVWAESEGPGKGSRFVAELPLGEAPRAASTPRRRAAPSSARILLVEDNADSRTMIADGLTLAGYDVHTVGSAEEALEVLGSVGVWEYGGMAKGGAAAPTGANSHTPILPHPHTPDRWAPDLMLVDIGLPGMDGFQFLRRVREMPGMAAVPAFAVTGWGTEEDVRRGREVGFAGHFIKPVNVPALLERIREWVGAGPSG